MTRRGQSVESSGRNSLFLYAESPSFSEKNWDGGLCLDLYLLEQKPKAPVYRFMRTIWYLDDECLNGGKVSEQEFGAMFIPVFLNRIVCVRIHFTKNEILASTLRHLPLVGLDLLYEVMDTNKFGGSMVFYKCVVVHECCFQFSSSGIHVCHWMYD